MDVPQEEAGPEARRALLQYRNLGHHGFLLLVDDSNQRVRAPVAGSVQGPPPPRPNAPCGFLGGEADRGQRAGA